MIKEYQKIESVFARDIKTKKTIDGQFTNVAVEYLKDNLWEFTEKVDGTNICVHWDGHRVVFGGRTADAQIPAPLVNYLAEKFGGEVNEQMFEQKFKGNPATLYGEGYGSGIQGGGTYRLDVAFILFDVEVDGWMLRRIGIEDVAAYFGLDAVPVLLRGTIADGVAYVRNNRASQVARGGHLIEGLVGKPLIELRDRADNRIITKIKYKDVS